jgi:hypothetical protein
MTRQLRISIAAAATLLSLALSANAEERGKTADGMDYATGGVTVADLTEMAQERSRYDLWVTAAAKGSGAFLSDVQLKITDAKNEVVLDTLMVGPWLFVDLEPGHYTIDARFKDQSLQRKVSVGRGQQQQQAILYFDSDAQVSPDWKSPFAKSPYASR